VWVPGAGGRRPGGAWRPECQGVACRPEQAAELDRRDSIQMAYSQAEGGRETAQADGEESGPRGFVEIAARPEAEKRIRGNPGERRTIRLEESTAVGTRCWWKAAGGLLDGPNAKG